MARIRILLARMSPMLRETISDLLASEHDMVIVGRRDCEKNSLVAAQAEGAHLIITQEDFPSEDPCLIAVLAEAPLAILAISPAGLAGTTVNLMRRSLRLDQGDSGVLANAVRQAVGAS